MCCDVRGGVSVSQEHRQCAVLFDRYCVAQTVLCCLTGIVEAQYMTELRKSYGGELMQMASAYIGDVNVTELRCRPLCVVLSCCHDGLPESLRKVVLGSATHNVSLFQLEMCTLHI